MPCLSRIPAPGHKFWSNASGVPGGMVILGTQRGTRKHFDRGAMLFFFGGGGSKFNKLLFLGLLKIGAVLEGLKK